jgi:hypothetical protein
LGGRRAARCGLQPAALRDSNHVVRRWRPGRRGIETQVDTGPTRPQTLGPCSSS